jgi:hypothetical protein
MPDKDKTSKAIEKRPERDPRARRKEPARSEVEQPEPLDEDSLDHVLRNAPL